MCLFVGQPRPSCFFTPPRALMLAVEREDARRKASGFKVWFAPKFSSCLCSAGSCHAFATSVFKFCCSILWMYVLSYVYNFTTEGRIAEGIVRVL